MKCPICKSNKKSQLWFDKIRSGKYQWTKKKVKIFKCLNCHVGYLDKFRYHLKDNEIFRKLFDGEASVKKYYQFNKPRELKKLNFIKKYISFKNKKILESNCGAAVILDELKKKSKLTAGIDSIIYKNHVEKKHIFFSSIDHLKKSNLKFDIILSLGEIEHQTNVYSFIKKLKNKLSKKGKIVFRIPNYDNIYRFFINKNFLKHDFRESHNYYFNQKSLDYLFKKLKLKVINKVGFQEYSTNHFIHFLKTQTRVKSKFPKYLNSSLDLGIIKNIETNMVSTSFLYIVSN